jgi:ABC-type cobalamin/Fe3+-siderophores transport system ATPase subunit
MIKTFKLKFGRAKGIEPETITAAPVTVFVGPNNSGKSKILSEIYQYCQTGSKYENFVLLEELTFIETPDEKISETIDHVKQVPGHADALQMGHILVGNASSRRQVNPDQLKMWLTSPTTNLSAFAQYFLQFATLILGGSNRINLVVTQPGGDLQQSAQSSFQMLFRDDIKRAEVRRIVYEAFGVYFVLDPTQLGQLRIRLSTVAPKSDLEERGIHADAVQFHAKAQLIDSASDGVKAFTGIVTELIAGDPRVVLIDEPEAFLHLSLAFKLGLEISRAVSFDKRVFASTHSPHFVMGCIQSGAPVNIVRLTYRNGIATSRLLPSKELLELMRNPLLRSTNVISGLFYEFVIVTEGDADRAFYQEINERLLRLKPEWGIPNCLFINAQNKQTIRTIVRPLRNLGIPAVAIVDVDALKEGGTNWTNLLGSANVPDLAQNSLGTLRAAVKTAMDATGKDMKREGGLAILTGAEQEAAQNLLDQVADYGIFVLPRGELESWLKGLGATGHGPSWLIEIFEKMGEDPESPSYVRPGNDDVWQFMSKIKTWLTDSDRKGIPQ